MKVRRENSKNRTHIYMEIHSFLIPHNVFSALPNPSYSYVIVYHKPKTDTPKRERERDYNMMELSQKNHAINGVLY